jgi:hypothetical protein
MIVVPLGNMENKTQMAGNKLRCRRPISETKTSKQFLLFNPA